MSEFSGVSPFYKRQSINQSINVLFYVCSHRGDRRQKRERERAYHYYYIMLTYPHDYFDGTLPPYLSNCLSSYTPHRSLRSSSDKLLCVPRVNLKSAGARSFQYQAPCVWNSVPIQIRLSPSLTSFKSSLKTHLFRTAFT